MTVQPPGFAAGPNATPTMVGRAMALHQSGQLDEAEQLYNSVLAVSPDHFEALHFLGLLAAQRKLYEEADRLMRRSLEINTGVAEAYANHARVLNALKRPEEALAACDRALSMNSRSIEAWVSRGNALAELDEHERALESFDRALALRPDYLAALKNRGSALLHLKRYQEALASCERALAINPHDAGMLNNRGIALAGLEKHEAALASYDAALAIDRDYAEAHYGRANVLRKLDRYDAALAAYERARSLNPDHPDAIELLHVALLICDWTRVADLKGELRARALEGRRFNSFSALVVDDDPALHQICAENLVKGIARQPSQRSPVRRHTRIRVAYCSPDFRGHPVSHLIAELIERHDRERFEILGISFGDDDDDGAVRRRLAKAFDQFHDVQALRDRDIARRLRDLEVDIAVDLAGHQHGGRPEIFSLRGAPVQVGYLGFYGTIGADFLDYILADEVVLPFDQQQFYAERIVHLPNSFLPHSDRSISERVPTRHEAGLPADAFVFCCFNHLAKIGAPLFRLWMGLLRKVEGSVLWLSPPNEFARDNLCREAQALGIDSTRLVFASRVRSMDDHLARHRLADLFLDTLPYNAHSTANDALWAGLPVLTCPGRAFVSRVAASLLHAVGLPELVTTSFAEYEAMALRLASDPTQLFAVRSKLARNRLTCPLFDIRRYARHIEAAYVKMWEAFQRGERPQSFTVEAIESP